MSQGFLFEEWQHTEHGLLLQPRNGTYINFKAPRKPRQYFTGHPTAPSTPTILYGGHYSINDQLGRHLKWAVEQGESGPEFPPRVTLKVKTHINFIVEIDTSQDA